MRACPRTSRPYRGTGTRARPSPSLRSKGERASASHRSIHDRSWVARMARCIRVDPPRFQPCAMVPDDIRHLRRKASPCEVVGRRSKASRRNHDRRRSGQAIERRSNAGAIGWSRRRSGSPRGRRGCGSWAWEGKSRKGEGAETRNQQVKTTLLTESVGLLKFTTSANCRPVAFR